MSTIIRKKYDLDKSMIAKRLGCSYRHIDGLVEEGRLKAVNIGSKSRKIYRFSEEDYSAFLEQNEY